MQTLEKLRKCSELNFIRMKQIESELFESYDSKKKHFRNKALFLVSLRYKHSW